MKILPYTIFLWIVLVFNPALADLMYCGDHLVNPGDTEYDVLKKCGPPSDKQGNKWFYEQGTGQFVKILIMENGKVAFVNAGKRGNNR